ncbi:MAG: DUF167 family protein [Alphaproteobacteria bacterium]
MVRLVPKASRPGIDGVGVDAAGRAFLKVRVGAPPEAGKANAALLRLLAREWRVPGSSLTITAGTKARRKTLHVAGDGALLVDRLMKWIEANHV